MLWQLWGSHAAAAACALASSRLINIAAVYKEGDAPDIHACMACITLVVISLISSLRLVRAWRASSQFAIRYAVLAGFQAWMHAGLHGFCGLTLMDISSIRS